MKICITASGETLNSTVDPRFGRAVFFIFVDPENQKEVEAVANPAMTAFRGAGITAAQEVINRQAEAVITGNIGPNAFAVLQTAGVRVFNGFGLTIQEAIDKYQRGELPEITRPMGGFGRRGGWGGGRR